MQAVSCRLCTGRELVLEHIFNAALLVYLSFLRPHFHKFIHLFSHPQVINETNKCRLSHHCASQRFPNAFSEAHHI